MNLASRNRQRTRVHQAAGAIALRAALLSAIWYALAGGGANAWVFGLAVILPALAASLWLLPLGSYPFSPAGFIRFLAYFLWQSVKGGVQVAAMALRPRPGLHPAMLDLQLRLDDETARAVLAATLSLLPGTLSARLDGRHLRVHVIDARRPMESEIRDAESHVAHMLKTRLQ